MTDYRKVKLEELNVKDIFFLDLDEENNPYNMYLILDQRNLTNLIGNTVVMNIKTNEIMTFDYESFSSVYYFCSIDDLIKMKSFHYRWLGFEYGKHKVLIDLLEGSIEKFNYEDNSWYEMEEKDIKYESQTVLVIHCEKNVHFKVDLEKLVMYVSNTKHYFNYNPFYNFLLGGENDYVFDAENNLILTKSEE